MPKKLLGWAFIYLLFLVVLLSQPVFAETLQSSNFKFDESSVGGDGELQANSTNYQLSNATGDLVIGNTASGNYQIEAGSITNQYPALSFTVDSSSVGLGVFTPSFATMSTATFSVSNYTSYGYIVQIVGNPPINEGHTISAMAETDVSKPGEEQFGINLATNTLPNIIGAEPNNGLFGLGSVAPNYGVANNYRYVSGETIALAQKSSGVTKYTITFMVNVKPTTIGGNYTSDQTLIVTGTY